MTEQAGRQVGRRSPPIGLSANGRWRWTSWHEVSYQPAHQAGTGVPL